VDTGFIVFNDRTYPILNRFFRELGVSIRKSDMSFGYFDEKSGFQYASSNLNSLFAQRRNLLDPGYWAMLAEFCCSIGGYEHRLKKGRWKMPYPRSVFTSIPVFRLASGSSICSPWWLPSGRHRTLRWTGFPCSPSHAFLTITAC
jgi:hypothetical protein